MMSHLLVELDLLLQETLHHGGHLCGAKTHHLWSLFRLVVHGCYRLCVELVLHVRFVEKVDGQNLDEVGLAREAAADADLVHVLEKQDVVDAVALVVYKFILLIKPRPAQRVVVTDHRGGVQ